MVRSDREKLMHILELRKQQKQILMDGIIKPLNDNINIIRDVMYGKDSIGHLLYHSKAVNRQLKGLFKHGD